MTGWQLYCALYCTEFTVLGPKCNSVDCLGVATAIVHWPSGPIRCCDACTARWRDIAARGLGMHLVVEPLPLITPPGLDDAEQRFRMMELT